jgi:putative nucleotidyltransferase with HDIG domain
MNLYELAQRKQLPKFQQMDSPTLDWIRAHRPDLGGWRYSDICSTLTAGPEIPTFDPGWFLEPRVADGLHGTRHALRVALFARALAAELGLSPTERQTVIAAALLHDIGRLHDQGDTEHGARGAKWVNENSDALAPLQNLDAADRATAALAILGHEIPYPGVEREPGYAAAGWTIDLLKTADALDRYRLPKTKWWLDDAFLKLRPSAALKSFAFDLVMESERRFLAGTESTTAVLGAYAELITSL